MKFQKTSVCQEDKPCQKPWIYQVLQLEQHKQLKTMEISEAWPDTFDEGYIHQFQPEPTHKITSSSRGTEFEDILPWNISWIIKNTVPISTRIVITNGASHCEYDGKSMETETTKWSDFPNGGKAIVEQILASEERKKSKRAGLSESQSGIWVGKLTIWFSNSLCSADGPDSSSTSISSEHSPSSTYVNVVNFSACCWYGEFGLNRHQFSLN